MKLIFTISIFVLSTCNFITAQSWEGRDASFPSSLWGEKVYAINDSVVWTLGIEYDSAGYGTLEETSISKSKDKGNTWYNVVTPFDNLSYVSSIWALDFNHAWLTYVEYPNGPTGQPGNSVVVTTTDGGFHWEPVNVHVNVWVDFIYMWNSQEGIVVGDPDSLGFEIYRTSDGGETWTRIMEGIEAEPGEIIYTDNYDVRGDELWFATNTGTIFHTPSRGTSWEVYDSPWQDNLAILKMNVNDKGDVLMVNNFYSGSTYAYTLFRRKAATGLWQSITVNNNIYVYDIVPVPNSDAIISTIIKGNAFLTRISYDLGSNWMIIDSAARATHLSFYDPYTGYATHANWFTDQTKTLVYRYTGSPLTGLIQQSPLLDVELSVSPNPTVDLINIQLKADSQENYWILLNSLSGDLIQKSVITDASGFSHVINMHALPAGAYMLTIANGNGVRTEKIIRL